MEVNSMCIVNPINIISVEIDIHEKKDVFCLKFNATNGKEHCSDWTTNVEMLKEKLIDISKQLDNFTEV